MPSEETALTGLAIKENIEENWSPPYYYYNHRDGGHIAAIKAHIGNDLFSKLDLKKFFNQINKSRITRNLKEILGYEKSRVIAAESTVILPRSRPVKYILPYGFVQSPIIASLCLRKSHIGSFLDKVVNTGVFCVSIYVDDIIISGQSENKEVLRSIYHQIIELSIKSGLPINETKSQPPSSEIEAFNIELKQGNLKITDKRMDMFIDAFYKTESQAVKDGITGYINSINNWQSSLL